MTAYFWKDGSVVEMEERMNVDTTPEALYHCPCVDGCHSEPDMRYGVFGKGGWDTKPLSRFPAEFRAHLLLLGVT